MSSYIQRTSEEERTYWEREMQKVERQNARDDIARATMNAQAAHIRSMARTSYMISIVNTILILLIVGIVVFGLVKLGIYIAGLF